jgi:hypothetical protein
MSLVSGCNIVLRSSASRVWQSVHRWYEPREAAVAEAVDRLAAARPPYQS